MKYCLILMLGIVLFGCKSDKSNEAEDIQNQIQETLSDAEASAAQIPEGDEATDTLQKPKDDSWQSYLATETWEFSKGIALGNSATEHVDGRWIRFRPDLTFETGKWENVITVGEWNVSDDGVLHLQPSDGTDRESEWRIRKKLNSMVWSGTPKFGNNTSQYFLVRRKGPPKQIF